MVTEVIVIRIPAINISRDVADPGRRDFTEPVRLPVFQEQNDGRFLPVGFREERAA